jgi:hypothetical protein
MDAWLLILVSVTNFGLRNIAEEVERIDDVV